MIWFGVFSVVALVVCLVQLLRRVRQLKLENHLLRQEGQHLFNVAKQLSK